MKKSQRDHISSMDDFEDLTLFANESFDTQDVDLFEFTSEESSPLTRLKSIILSLDWEINDEILQELDDELVNLQAMWQGDKVAEVYLQGLSKIGSYIRTKGAYAHPNSIKLLLTFFYNFEKIISSEQITGDQITQLLKGDVRKFKILQYQINQSEATSPAVGDALLSTEQSGAAPAISPAPEPEDPSKQLKAAILSLDWEVTDESLRQFNDKIAGFYPHITDNKPALVLVQGLQALGDYIAEERADAHPEAFILLHAFNEALDQVLHPEAHRLNQEAVQELLVDRINRLNNLKLLITSPTGALVDDQRIDEVVEELSAPVAMEQPAPAVEKTQSEAVASISFAEAPAIETGIGQVSEFAPSTDSLEAEIDTLFNMDAMPAMESADVQYPDEVLPPDAIHPIEDELPDDFIESQLSSKRGLMPALADAEESSGFNESAQPLDLPTQSDLAEQLDFLFADSESSGASAITFSALDSAELELAIAHDDEEPVAGGDGTGADEDLEEAEAPFLSALSDAEIPEGREEQALELETAVPDGNVFDIQSKLDSFFADADEEPVEAAAPASTAVDEIEQELFFDEEDNVQAALADSAEERGFSEEAEVAALSFTPLDEIEEKLDFFFGSDTEEESDTALAMGDVTMRPPLEEALDLTVGAPETVADIAPALSGLDADEQEVEEDLALLADDDETDGELSGALDDFFAESTAAESPLSTPVDELTSALEATMADDQPDSAEIQLATLGALLPAVVRTPSRDNIVKAVEAIVALKQLDLSATQLALVQLLESVLTLLIRLPTREDAATEKLVNHLYQQLIAEHGQLDVLAEAVGRYTTWLQQAATIMPVVPAASDQDQETSFTYTGKELYFELAELRSHIRDEFVKLRRELHHHK